ncbi:histamine N-methyltransferase-like [Apostichopus japonicus]|uniref:histamine N-methyltransferase-like n=1 Tax=Stichopus japonicus TaxID=307972 RepID=UPI003AB47678
MESSSEISVKDISHDPSYYSKAFNVFVRHSTEHQMIATWAETIFPRTVVEKIPISKHNREKKLEILGFGSGTGDLDFKMIAQLLKKFPSISNTVVEPNPDHIVEYKKLVDSKSFGSDVDFNWRQQTWQEYYKECQQPNKVKKFHFISAIHSLYYVEDPEATILDIVSCLDEGGILLLVLISENGGVIRQQKRFLSDAQRLVSSETIRKILEKCQLKFEAFTETSTVDITCCYEAGNQDGVLLADFINNVKLQESGPPSFVEEVLSYMREGAVQNGDQILLATEWQVIVVTK